MRATQIRSLLLHHAAAPGLLVVAVCLWNWPVLAGRQPAGGDVSAFFYPLMTSYSRSLAEGNWPPLWNDRWGYGFPALAESQMGVFYPPHILLFGLVAPEVAYGVNLLVHMALAALFAYWAGRAMGLGARGAGLCGLVFFAGDFFTVHAPHQWAYTTGCWFPMAVLLAWRTAGLGPLHRVTGPGAQAVDRQRRPKSRILPPVLLAGVLAIQMLGGHFQIAFYTQVTVLVIGLGGLRASGTAWTRRFAGAGGVVAAWVGGVLLASVQLLPTAELANQSTPHAGDYEYLSGFANTPWHLVNYLAGSLFHSSPLWKGVVWSPSAAGAADAWHTAPEECLNYVGLVPLCLVLGGWRRWWRRGSARLCAALLTLSLLLSFGPFLPGFGWLIRLPGFGWFRSAARWNVATTFWLGLLAGAAIEQLSAAELRRAMRRFAIFWAAAIAVLVAAIWSLGHATTPRDGPIARAIGFVWQNTSPWGSGQRFDEIVRHMHVPPDQSDARIVAQLVEEGRPLAELAASWPDLTVADQWPSLLLREVGPYAGVLAVIAVLCCLPRVSEARLKAALLLLTFVDLALLSTLRPLSWQPVGYLEKSPVLEALAQSAEPGTVHRTVDPLRNLPLVAGAAPLLTYRTLDVPAFPTLPMTALADVGVHRVRPEVKWVFDLSGIGTVIHAAVPSIAPAPGARVETLSDPVLVATLFGERYADELATANPELLEYDVLHFERAASQAWTMAASDGRGDAITLENLPDPASVEPARVRRFSPHHVVIEATAEGPAMLVLTDLYYPGWEASLETATSKQPAAIGKAFGAWRGIALPRAGRYRVTLLYRSRPFIWGAWLSAASWSVWLVLVVGTIAARRRGHGEAGAKQPAAAQ